MSATEIADPSTELSDSVDAIEENDGFDKLPADFEFLTTPELPEGDYRPGESLEEYLERKETEDKAAEEEAAKAQEATSKEPEKKEVAEKSDKTESDTTPADSSLKQKAELWDKFADTLDQSPESVINALLKNMPDDRRQAYLQKTFSEVAPTDPIPDIDAATYEPQSDLEEVLLARLPDIKAITELRKEVADLRQNAGQALQEQVRALHDPISTSVYYGELAMAKFEAICQAVGLDLPDPDINAVREKLQDGRTTIKSAVRALVSEQYNKKVAEHKQARAERPRTPGSSTTRQPAIKPGSSMYDIAKMIGEL